LGLFFLFSEPFAPQTYAAQENPCVACHPEFNQKFKSIHAALGMGCATCHKQVGGKNHPAEKGSIILTQSMPGLCYTCHDESKFKGKSVHQAVSGGMCTGCHDAHQSNYPKILLKDIPGICYNCHDPKKFRGKSGHTNIGMCSGCHNPHSSDFNKLVKTTQPELCFSCHEKDKFSKKYVHSIIATGGCTSCHSPHTTMYPSLLPSSVQELCITCHAAKNDGRHITSLPGKKVHPIKGIDPSTVKMIQAPHPDRPGVIIEQRDPNAPGKEITCATCHDPHSSDYRKLFTQKNMCARCHKYY
jgi:predicted CXXCH cytochrome family protein